MRYRPDGNLYEPGLLYDIREFAANNNGAYERVPSMKSAGYAALAATCLGSGFIKTSAGTAKAFAGRATKVYQADGAAGWTDRSGAITFAATTWEFCSFGANTIAVNGNAKVQIATTGNFADITDAPTAATIIFEHANALVALGGANGDDWARCKTGDHTTWTAAANNDADSGRLYGGVGGPIVAGCNFGTLAIAWKSNAMYTGVYIGNADPDQEVLRWTKVPGRFGCVGQWSYVECEAGLVFVSERDILLFNGNKPVSIADDIRKTWIAEAAGNRSSIFCTLDEPRNHVYFWSSPSGQTNCSRAWVWNYKTGLWGKLVSLNDVDASLFGNAKLPVRNANYQDMVAVGGFSTNSREICNLFFDNSQFKIVNLAGATYATGDAYLRTGFKGTPGNDVELERVYCIADSYTAMATTPTLNVVAYTHNKLVSQTVASSALTAGAYWDLKAVGRWLELQASFPAAAGVVSIADLLCQVRHINVMPRDRELI